jgi:hypothetical protein
MLDDLTKQPGMLRAWHVGIVEELDSAACCTQGQRAGRGADAGRQLGQRGKRDWVRLKGIDNRLRRKLAQQFRVWSCVGADVEGTAAAVGSGTFVLR